jgi:hypothetical protein
MSQLFQNIREDVFGLLLIIALKIAVYIGNPDTFVFSEASDKIFNYD